MHIENLDSYLRARYLLGRIVKCRETPQYPQDLCDGLKISSSKPQPALRPVISDYNEEASSDASCMVHSTEVLLTSDSPYPAIADVLQTLEGKDFLDVRRYAYSARLFAIRNLKHV